MVGTGAGPRALVVAIALAGVTAWGAAVAFGLDRPADQAPLEPTDVLWAASFFAFLVLGAWIARRRPANPVGWCLALGPVFIGTGVAAFEYAADPGRAGAAWVGLLGNPAFDVGVVLLAIWSLWYPDGRLPSPRWRWLVRAIVAIAVLTVITQVLTSTPYSEDVPTASPLAIGLPAVDAVHGAVRLALPLLALSAFVSLVVRFRRGRPEVRDQVKLLLFGVSLVAGAAAVLTAVTLVAGETPLIAVVGLALMVATLLCIPITVAVAIVRHRAFEIDRAISRTVAYALITAIAVGVYAAGVLAFGTLARAVAGESGDVVVALSTLLVASAFQPMRRRVQGAVDRRFNRARVDGMQAAEEFSRRLRDEVDLAAVVADLRGTVVRTLQPSSASVVTVGGSGERP